MLLTSFRKLYLFVADPAMKAIVADNIAKWRPTDSGFNIPVLQAEVAPTNGSARKLSTTCYGALNDEQCGPAAFLVLPRSSTGSKTPLRLANSIGLIDSGYRGELMICVDNHSSSNYEVLAGSLLFQVTAGDYQPFGAVVLVDTLEELPSPSSGDNRGAGGFGSTTGEPAPDTTTEEPVTTTNETATT
jgi:dUTP pyrophosphatase